jgi:hypothetical protein
VIEKSNSLEVNAKPSVLSNSGSELKPRFWTSINKRELISTEHLQLELLLYLVAGNL